MKIQTQSQNRNKVVRFKVTNQELQIIKGCALLDNVTVSKYLRNLLYL